ncbi:MAG: hypothetical protein RBT76_02445 [candidate division Zixibacteria bacterium]|nr:hypothetical protein [candidate division Zixibacteria bacterium]
MDLTTKDFPDVRTFTFSTSAGHNSQTTGKSILFSNEGSKDWLGYDDGKRDLPPAKVGIDMTKVMTGSGWAYRMLVLDWYTKRIAGYHCGPRATTKRFMQTCSLLDVHHAFTSYNNPKRNADTERLMRTIKEEYNEHYPHSALGYKTPNQTEESYILTTRTLLQNAD